MSHARFSVSSWSLHRSLGQPPIFGVESGSSIPAFDLPPSALALHELPARVAALKIRTLEICHFHLPSRDADDLHALRGALEASGVELFSFLVDEGDITHPEHAARDEEWIAGWFEIASALGARCVRVIAGKSPPSDAMLLQSRDSLLRLADLAEQQGLRLMTENWFQLLSSPDPTLRLFDGLQGRVGLCLDFGNWSGADKYDQLAQIAHLAESCHARADFVGGSVGEPPQLETDDFLRCLQLTRDTNFGGPYTLIPSGAVRDEWHALTVARDAARLFVGQNPAS